MKLEQINSAAGYIASRLLSNMKLKPATLGCDSAAMHWWIKDTVKSIIGAPTSLIDRRCGAATLGDDAVTKDDFSW